MIVKKHLLQAVTVLCAMMSAAFLVDCSSFNIFPLSQDIQLGEGLDKEIRSKPAQYPILNDAQTTNYVQQIVNQLINSPSIKYRGKFLYKATVLNDKTLNAFCTPGGYIYVYTGLMKTLDNEASLAAVLGHEIAHAEMRHSTQRMTKAYGAELVLDIALGKNPSKTAEVAGNLFTGLALLKNSRDDESEADSYSFEYMKSSKWYPASIAYFFEKIKGTARGGVIESWTSTHPLPQDRIDANNERARKANLAPPTESNLYARPYQDMKARLP